MDDQELSLINSIVEDSGSEIPLFISFWNDHQNDVCVEILYNVMTSFFLGVFDKNGIELCIIQFSQYEIEFQPVLNDWSKHLKQLSEDTLKQVFTEFIVQLNALNKTKQDNLNCVKSMFKCLCSLRAFRKCLPCMEDHKNGIDYETQGLFSPLFGRSQKFFASNHLNNYNTVDVHELFTVITDLLKDESLSETLLNYVHKILCANSQFTREDTNYINTKTSSSLSFNKFIMFICCEIIKIYGFETLNSDIMDCDDCVVKDYDISSDKTLTIAQKLYVVLAKAIPICHTSSIKFYHKHHGELLQLKQMESFMSMLSGANSSKRTEILESKMASLKSIFCCDIGNNMLQNFYINYYKVHQKFKIDGIYNDIVSFTDMITSFENIDEMYGYVNSEMYNICSQMTGDSTIDKHTRHYGAELLFKIIPTEGYSVAPTIFSDLFKYIGDVDYYKWLSIFSAVKHHKKILQNMIMLLDYPSKVFEQPDRIISKTLYNLLKHAIESYTQFTSICEKLKDDPMFAELGTLFNDLLEVIMMTLTVYSGIYTNAIVKNSYAENEEKYSILVKVLIESATNRESVIYKILHRPDLARQLKTITYRSLNDHIDVSAKYLNKNKELILSGLDDSGLTEEQNLNICNIFNSIVENTIEYDDEFLDPILYTPINYPVKLPGQKGIYDRVSVVSHIHEKSESFYREPLTLQEFDDYNQTPEVIDEVTKFIERKRLFEENYVPTKNSTE
jgi:hypothetical protein